MNNEWKLELSIGILKYIDRELEVLHDFSYILFLFTYGIIQLEQKDSVLDLQISLNTFCGKRALLMNFSTKTTTRKKSSISTKPVDISYR